MNDIYNKFKFLSRIALSGRQQDIYNYIYEVAKNSKNSEFTSDLQKILKKSYSTQNAHLSGRTDLPLPIDSDSKIPLVQIEEFQKLPHEPVFSESIFEILSRLVVEREKFDLLNNADIEPTKTVLFTGPPGVGKTLAARWLARETERPLIILDLASVMSRFLGNTGANLKMVLDYAKGKDCILLLDELDSIAKRRDDIGEVGELKRLVTVLLQQLDDWSSSNVLISATNHPGLLDPAIWRRFEEHIQFDLPESDEIKTFVKDLLKLELPVESEWFDIMPILFQNQSFSDIERTIKNLRKTALLKGLEFKSLLEDFFDYGESSSDNQKISSTKLPKKVLTNMSNLSTQSLMSAMKLNKKVA